MTYKTVLSILGLSLFIAICYFMFIRPWITTKSSSFSGRVISIAKQKREAGYLITIREEKTEFAFYYSFQNNFDIEIGDSIFKNTNSKILYVKSLKDSIIREANDQDFLVPAGARTLIK
ncbi:hypothetical protein PDL71_07865 [Lacibacter sp. MH-610]|uniref:hypothetical protein n=1 Tax=Lacibacter sp. MH-610 TaxID=3020883 RepID=UPI0038915FA6